jgi:hypothetical protein
MLHIIYFFHFFSQEHAFESSQKYKEGKFIIELAHMIKELLALPINEQLKQELSNITSVQFMWHYTRFKNIKIIWTLIKTGCQSQPLSFIMWASSMINFPSLYF